MSDDTTPVSTSLEGPTLVVRIDDGKANAITHALVDGIGAALDRAQGDPAIGAIALIGREGKFSAGFDLAVMQSGMDAARALLRAGGELALRIFTFPKPVVVGCTGHALAMGAILLMAADVRIGADGPFKIGLNEVAIGMPVPRFALELGRDRLSKRHFVGAVNHAQVYTPAQATDVGYLDRVVEPAQVDAEAVTTATQMAEGLNPAAFALTRSFMRTELAEQLQTGMDRDMALFNIAQ